MSVACRGRKTPPQAKISHFWSVWRKNWKKLSTGWRRTIPIVRETGGLRDSVTDDGNHDGNGFTFKTYNAHDMLDACRRAKESYDDQAQWAALVKRALETDFSWSSSADSYIALYKELCNF